MRSWLGPPIFFTALAMATSNAAETSAEAPSEMKHGEPLPLWSRTVALQTPPPSHIIIEGAEVDGRFVPHAVSIPYDEQEQASKVALPLGENLIDRLEARPFGSEERVEAVRLRGTLAIRCGEGAAPAGVVLETGNAHIPRTASLRLVAAGTGSTELFGLSVVERGSDAPTPWQGQIGANGSVSLLLPPSLGEAPAHRDIVINCPAGQSRIRLDSISLEPARPAVEAPRVGTWLWEAEAWLAEPGQVEDWAVASQLDRVFLQLRLADGKVAGGSALANLVGRLRKRGILVHAVEGDPAMITADGLDYALQRVAAIRRYQVSSPPDTRLSGLQFDIEPYLLADFARDPAAVWTQWAEAIQLLSSAWGEPVSVVVPFWMLNSEAGRAAAATASHTISDLTVMAYRTQTGEVTALSEPWLAWGMFNDIPVSVAIENGSLNVEAHRTFVRAETGNVLLKTEGQLATIALFSEPVETRGDALAYAFHEETRVNPARISFMNDRAKLAVARADLTRLLVAWPSFDGLMIHALDEPDRDLGRAPPDTGGQNQ